MIDYDAREPTLFAKWFQVQLRGAQSLPCSPAVIVVASLSSPSGPPLRFIFSLVGDAIYMLAVGDQDCASAPAGEPTTTFQPFGVSHMHEPRCYFYNDYQGHTALETIGGDNYQISVLVWFDALSDHYGLHVENTHTAQGKKNRVVRVFNKAALHYLSPLARRLTRGVYEISVALGHGACPPKLVPDQTTRKEVYSQRIEGPNREPFVELIPGEIDALAWEYFSVPGYVIYPDKFPLW